MIKAFFTLFFNTFLYFIAFSRRSGSLNNELFYRLKSTLVVQYAVTSLQLSHQPEIYGYRIGIVYSITSIICSNSCIVFARKSRLFLLGICVINHR